MDLEGYARFYAAMEGKSEAQTDEVLAALGQTRSALDAAKRAFDEPLTHDPKLRAEMSARVLVARANISRSLAPPAVARFVRSTRCHHCGGAKRTEPRTAYVYCDYCGVLYDYDTNKAETDYGDLALFQILVDGVRAQIRAAYARQDWVAYRAAWRWPYEMDMTIFPDS
jgi:hypothetical protein